MQKAIIQFQRKKSGRTEMGVKEWTEYYWHMPN